MQGDVKVSGAKNAALPILASVLLGGGECVVSNVPRVVDVLTMGKLLRLLGASVQVEGDRVVMKMDALRSSEAPYELVRTMRAPRFTRKAARSRISGSFATFSITVVPSARHAASIRFSVPVTVGKSRQIRAPFKRAAFALI